MTTPKSTDGVRAEPAVEQLQPGDVTNRTAIRERVADLLADAIVEEILKNAPEHHPKPPS